MLFSVVSTRSTLPALLYILIALRFTRCLIRTPSYFKGLLAMSLITSPANRGVIPADTLRPKKPHHLPAAKALHPVADQTWIQPLQIRSLPEHDVAAPFALIQGPVVADAVIPHDPLEHRIDRR